MIIDDSLALLTLVSSIVAHLLLPNCKGLPAHGASAVPEQKMRIEERRKEYYEKVFNLESQPSRQAGWQACCLEALHPGRTSCISIFKSFDKSKAEQVVAPGLQSGKGRRRPGSCRCWTRPPPPGSPGPRSTEQSGGGCEKEVADLDAGRRHGRNASLLMLSLLHNQHYFV